ncbi:MAG: 3-dehydroquinate synthase [Prolixibacteraceae bacterium]|nr:3-dehydroquinate synthase [Prolixibacteraceae bacterium]
MKISNSQADIIFSNRIPDDIDLLITEYGADNIFMLTESKFHKLWSGDFFSHFDIPVLTLPAGEESKNIDNVLKIWNFLEIGGAKRDSLLINIGGGMITDLGGFAASTFKRGIDVVNIPTTLLAQVDASAGGKTGVNFNGLKNEIGTFYMPDCVFINTEFLKTLDHADFLSGYAEMLKHGLIFSAVHFGKLRKYNVAEPNYNLLQPIIKQSINIKKYFVDNDPQEKNIRKALNFGHTIGHALESLAMEQQKPVLHGFAVAWGMIAEMWLSIGKCGFPEQKAKEIRQWIIEIYGKPDFKSSDYERIFQLTHHDKKNETDQINFTLISNIGHFVINQNCNKEDQIFAALDFLRQS